MPIQETSYKIPTVHRFLAIMSGLLLMVSVAHAQTRPESNNYFIPSDVQPVGGGEAAKSTNYMLDDTIGEANIGTSASDNYDLGAGYRQTLETFLSLGCDPDPIDIGTIVFSGQKTGSGSCIVITDNEAGYSLSWTISTGSGGTNTGHLISPEEDSVPPLFASRTGLVGHWRLDETVTGSTDSVIDVSGNGNHGTPIGAAGDNNKPQPSTEVPSNTNFLTTRSLNFDGTDDAVTIIDGSSVSTVANGSFSLCSWARTTSTDTRRNILRRDNFSDQGAEDRRLVTLNFNLGKPNIAITADGNVLEAESADSAADGEWHHVCAVRNTVADHIRIYVDGVLKATTNDTTTATINTAREPWVIGMVNTVSSIQHWQDDIDDVRIYSRALTLSEIKALYNEPQSWTVSATESAWAGRLSSRSTDTDAKWGTDGSSDKWLHVGDGNYTVVSRASRTDPVGSTEIFEFRSEIGANKVQPAATYKATATFTATAL